MRYADDRSDRCHSGQHNAMATAARLIDQPADSAVAVDPLLIRD
jgi:hypothetical protein